MDDQLRAASLGEVGSGRFDRACAAVPLRETILPGLTGTWAIWNAYEMHMKRVCKGKESGSKG